MTGTIVMDVRSGKLSFLAAALASLTVASPIGAQGPTPPDAFARPGDRDRLDAPAPIDRERPRFDLPPAKSLVPDPRAVRNQTRFTLAAIETRGVRSLPQGEVDAVTAGYIGRPITLLDLREMTNALTALYVGRGFVNSGFRIPDQDVGDGALIVEAVEGVLSEIEISGSDELSDAYITKRLEKGLDAPFDLGRLEKNFQLITENPNIAEIDAKLAPGAEPGQARLLVDVREVKPWALTVMAASERSPSVGGDRVSVTGEMRSLLFSGDYAVLGAGAGEGFWDGSLAYSAPINRHDWTVAFGVDLSDSEVIEAPFDQLDVESDGETYRIDLIAPVRQSFGERFNLSFGAERRVVETALLGIPFSFTPGAVNGETDLTFLRFGQELIKRDRRQAFALKSTFNYGVDGPNGLVATPGTPEENFFNWIGQARYVRRHASAPRKLIAQLDLQLADGPQYSVMRYSLGGIDSVRGYRRNATLADNAARASLAWESALPRSWGDQTLPNLVGRVFVDAGYGWNDDAVADPIAQSLAGVGLEIEWRATERVSLLGYFAQDIGDEVDVADETLQDRGFGYRLVARF